MSGELLRRAATFGELEALKALLEQGSNPCSIDVSNLCATLILVMISILAIEITTSCPYPPYSKLIVSWLCIFSSVLECRCSEIYISPDMTTDPPSTWSIRRVTLSDMSGFLVDVMLHNSACLLLQLSIHANFRRTGCLGHVIRGGIR